ncbi:MAG: NFACT RNA binding domain-containing protein [Cyclobacteriaceae bacterium]|nr:DUF814 domain-containing protein [Cyclobacteriaceae bacterium]MCH8514861.1 NFACT RNA binding domain-containing protein [Cyclobacteriaceae bacterium]
MHNNYHFFKHLVPAIAERITGGRLIECFTQNKNELILGFSTKNSEDFYIKAALSPEFSCLSFPNQFARAGRNSMDLFEDVLQKRVERLYLYKNERAFGVFFEDGLQWLFKMHGNRSNILLFRDEELLELFKKKLAKDHELNPREMDREVDQSFARYLELEENVKRIFPTFGPRVMDYLIEKGYNQCEGAEARFAMIQASIDRMDEGKLFICSSGEQPFLSCLPVGEVLASFDDPIAASNEFFYGFISSYHLDNQKQQLIKQLEKRSKQAFNYIEKSKSKLKQLQEGLGHKEKADVIMANMHQIPKGAKSALLFNFYSNKEEKFELKPTLSPQKLAEQYYRKAKNQRLEEENLQMNLDHKEQEWLQLQSWIEQFNTAEDFKAFKKLKKEFTGTSVAKNTENLPYNVLQYEGYEIRIGKGAAHNDELTFRYANKNDMWLHARDVPGSHVIIKQKPGSNFGKNILEKAASIAAWYSKRKTDALCPVDYTLKKYVRKIKGAKAGAVNFEKEHTIMVPPEKPDFK